MGSNRQMDRKTNNKKVNPYTVTKLVKALNDIISIICVKHHNLPCTNGGIFKPKEAVQETYLFLSEFRGRSFLLISNNLSFF